jgi:hypothetical protein
MSGVATGIAILAVLLVAVGVVALVVWVLALVARQFTAAGKLARANQRAPILTAPARLIEERVSLARAAGDGHLSETNYATFELADGTRLEFAIPASDAGLITAGDTGQLTWQGTWFRGFRREILR